MFLNYHLFLNQEFHTLYKQYCITCVYQAHMRLCCVFKPHNYWWQEKCVKLHKAEAVLFLKSVSILAQVTCTYCNGQSSAVYLPLGTGTIYKSPVLCEISLLQFHRLGVCRRLTLLIVALFDVYNRLCYFSCFSLTLTVLLQPHKVHPNALQIHLSEITHQCVIVIVGLSGIFYRPAPLNISLSLSHKEIIINVIFLAVSAYHNL